MILIFMFTQILIVMRGLHAFKEMVGKRYLGVKAVGVSVGITVSVQSPTLIFFSENRRSTIEKGR